MQSQKIVLRAALAFEFMCKQATELAMVKWSLLQHCQWKQDKSSAGTTAAAAAAAVCYNLIDAAIKVYSIVTFSAVLWVTQHAKNHFPLWASPCYRTLHLPFSSSVRLGEKCLPN